MVVLGCGGDDSGLARRYKVTGKVTYKGDSLARGTVNFIPTKPPAPEGRAASGEIKDGYYSLTTTGDNDGALPGDYNITVVSVDLDLKSASDANPEGIIHQGDPAHQKAIKGGKSLIPTKYNMAETSGLKATVKAESNQIDLPLTD